MIRSSLLQRQLILLLQNGKQLPQQQHQQQQRILVRPIITTLLQSKSQQCQQQQPTIIRPYCAATINNNNNHINFIRKNEVISFYQSNTFTATTTTTPPSSSLTIQTRTFTTTKKNDDNNNNNNNNNPNDIVITTTSADSVQSLTDTTSSNNTTTSTTTVHSTSPFDISNRTATSHSPLLKSNKKHKKHKFMPRKSAVALSDQARKYFHIVLQEPPSSDIIGILLKFQQSNTGEPRMVFTFDYVTAADIDINADEGVSLEVIESIDKEGNPIQIPKSPTDSYNDGLRKLYIHHDAFMKVLGCTIDIDMKSMTPILYDRDGYIMDPNN